MIPPLLFFPLIENAFKHGIGSNPEDKKIGLTFTMEGNRLFFMIRNAKGRIHNEFQKKKKGGIGIENVRKRLDLLYPDKHSMKVLDKEDSFEVEITIENVDVVN